MMEENSSRKVFLSVLGVAILIVAVVGISYAAYTFTNSNAGTNTIATGTITTTYTEAAQGLELVNALPITDATGEANPDYFDFTVATAAATNSKVSIGYTIKAQVIGLDAEDVTANRTLLLSDEVKVRLTQIPAIGSSIDIAEETEIYDTAKLAVGLQPNAEVTLANGTHSYDTVEKGNSQSTSYRFRMWIAEDAEPEDWGGTKTWKMRINVTATAAPLS